MSFDENDIRNLVKFKTDREGMKWTQLWLNSRLFKFWPTRKQEANMIYEEETNTSYYKAYRLIFIVIDLKLYLNLETLKKEEMRAHTCTKMDINQAG